MDVLISILCDILHITKFLVVCDLFLVFSKKKSKRIDIYLMTVLMSIFFCLFISNFNVKLMLYLIFVVFVYALGYKEKLKKYC